MKTFVICLIGCLIVLGLSLAFRLRGNSSGKLVLVVDDERSTDDAWMSKVLSACPGTFLSFDKAQSSDHYLALLLWRENKWNGTLWRDASGEEYLLWARNSSDYGKLLADMCVQAQDDWKHPLPPAQSHDARYDLHDLRNGNVATSAILDRQTGRVWIWSSITDRKGVKTKSEFVEEELSPSPAK
jgi:hypothetical protein